MPTKSLARRLVAPLLLVTLCGGAPLAAQSAAELRALAEQRYAEGDLEAAGAAYRRLAAAENEPGQRAAALVSAAWLDHLMGDRDGAQATLNQALVIDIDFAFQPANYNREFTDLYNEALRYAGIERARMAAEANALAIESLERSDYDGARAQLRRALTLKPNDPVLLGNLALTELRAGNNDAAIAEYQKVVALDLAAGDAPEIPEDLRITARTALGALFLSLGSLEDAEENLAAAVELDPGHRVAWQNLSAARRRLGDVAGAVAALERARQLAPNDPLIVRELANLHQQAGNSRAVVELLSEVAGDNPASADLWLQLGLAALELDTAGSIDAVNALQRAVALDPGNQQGIAARAGRQLAYQHLTAERYDRALTVSRRLAEWQPGEADSWTYLGTAQRETGDAAGAIASFERALELEPGNAETLNNLGTAHQELGDLEAAEAAFRAALAAKPDFPTAATNLDQVRQLLVAPTRRIGLTLTDASPRGARIESVRASSAAEIAKLRPGDVILAVDGRPVAAAADFRQLAFRKRLQGTVTFEILRDGRDKRVRVRLE